MTAQPGPKTRKPDAKAWTIRFSPVDHALLVALAKHHDTSMTAVIERMIRAEAERLQISTTP